MPKEYVIYGTGANKSIRSCPPLQGTKGISKFPQYIYIYIYILKWRVETRLDSINIYIQSQVLVKATLLI